MQSASKRADAVAAGDPASIDQQVLELSSLEDVVGLWTVPQVLAAASRYQREAFPDVVMEGWLYKKNTTMISALSKPWQRRWFVMDRDSIYFYRRKS